MKNLKFFACGLAPFIVPATLFSQAVIHNTNNSAPSTAGNYSSSTVEGQSDKFFDANTDVFDPGEGVLQWKGKIYNIEDTKIIRERFERYLSAPVPEKSAAEYTKFLKKVRDLLAQQNIPQNKVNEQMIKALPVLISMSEFEVDGKQSLTLMQQVYKTCRQRSEIRDIAAWQRALEKEQKELQSKVQNREVLRRTKSQPYKASGGKKGKDGSAGSIVSDNAPTPEQAFLTEAVAKNKAAQNSAGTQAEVSTVQAKLEFQSVMASMLLSRRYEHAKLSTAFYRTIFKGSHSKLQVGEKEIADMLPISNFVPSLESFDQIAHELQQETKKFVKSANTLWENGQKYHAFRQLLSAFFIGEHELCVVYYPAKRKREFLKMCLAINELQRQSENKDIGAIEASLAEITAIAPDFPCANIKGKIRAAKQASDMALLRARQTALLAGTAGTPEALEKAMEEIDAYITKAMTFWPQNPGIPEFLKEVLQRTDVMAQLAPEFDRLVAAGKKREIYNRRAEFTAALMQDAARRKRFEEIVAHVATIEAALAQVNMLLARRDEYIAWDMLLKAETLDANDEILIATKSKVAPLVSDYSRRLSLAIQEEKQGNFAGALNHYLAAQNINATSEICRTGLERCAELLLNAQSAGTSKPASAQDAETEAALKL